MSLTYYLVCHSKEMAVVIGDDIVRDVNAWPEQIPHINNFLNLTMGENIVCLNDEGAEFKKCEDYVILG